jgi:hypothetical protein
MSPASDMKKNSTGLLAAASQRHSNACKFRSVLAAPNATECLCSGGFKQVLGHCLGVPCVLAAPALVEQVQCLQVFNWQPEVQLPVLSHVIWITASGQDGVPVV